MTVDKMISTLQTASKAGLGSKEIRAAGGYTIEVTYVYRVDYLNPVDPVDPVVTVNHLEVSPA